MIIKDPVWSITGCSKGLGRALAREALAAGYRVVVAARRIEHFADLVDERGDAVLGLALDVTHSVQIRAAVAAAEDRFGAVDVLVNNAGHGYIAAIEEGEETEIRALFETDLFAPIALIRAVLPEMRARRRGHIMNVSSIVGLVSYPGVGYHNMVKFGVEALSDPPPSASRRRRLTIIRKLPAGHRRARKLATASNRAIQPVALVPSSRPSRRTGRLHR